jgi:beta-glucosidase/6-phospho-beta-glucosidase/beta-galactosidase
MVEPSGDAADHFHRYPEDMRLLADAGLNSYRFSMERWTWNSNTECQEIRAAPGADRSTEVPCSEM